MILILSIKNDPCTEDVITWLRKFKGSFIRINPEDIVQLKKFKINANGDSIVIKVNNHILDFSAITSFWYRRGEAFDNGSMFGIGVGYIKRGRKISKLFSIGLNGQQLDGFFILIDPNSGEIEEIKSKILAKSISFNLAVQF